MFQQSTSGYRDQAHRQQGVRASIVAATLCLIVGSGLAQEFNSGSDGSDGVLDFTGQSGTVYFDPTEFDPPLDPERDGVFHFVSVHIPAGVTVRLRADRFPYPVYWLSQGDITIEGKLDLNGEAGGSSGGTASMPAVAGTGGYFGGAGADSQLPATAGSGPGGGLAGASSGSSSGFKGQGAAHITVGGAGGLGNLSNSKTYGNHHLIALIGGSGGGGGGGTLSGTSVSGGGGAGGGAIVLASSSKIVLQGTTSAISANGGNGGSGTTYGGGAGSGGAIRLIAPEVTGNGSISVLGGTGTGSNPGGLGSNGRIRIESSHMTFAGPIAGQVTAARLTPATLYLRNELPKLITIKSIAGVALPDVPEGILFTPDVSIDSITPAEIELEAVHVPAGTAITLQIYSDTDGLKTVQSTPLVEQPDGTLTATAMAAFSHGPSQILVIAKWDPNP